MAANEIAAPRRGERVAAPRAIACLPILTDNEIAEAPSLFASGSSHDSGNVSSPSCPVPGFPESPLFASIGAVPRTDDQTDSRRLRLTVCGSELKGREPAT